MILQRMAALAAVGFVVSGCATVFEGLHQNISVATSPGDAACDFERQGQSIGSIANTPGTLSVRKDKHDILIRCTKAGYQEAQYLNHSGTTATIAANVAADLLLTWGASSIVDSADGADNKYDSVVNVTLMPLPAPAPGAAVIPAQTTGSKSSPSKPGS